MSDVLTAEQQIDTLRKACAGLIDVFGYVECVTQGGGFIPVMLGIDWQERVAAGRAALDGKVAGGATGRPEEQLAAHLPTE